MRSNLTAFISYSDTVSSLLLTVTLFQSNQLIFLIIKMIGYSDTVGSLLLTMKLSQIPNSVTVKERDCKVIVSC